MSLVSKRSGSRRRAVGTVSRIRSGTVLALCAWAVTWPLVAQVLPVPDSKAEESAAALPVTVDSRTDRRLEESLHKRLGPIEGLEELTVEVRAGWVYLGGTARSAEARDEAESIARRTEGVVEVENAIELSTQVGERLAPALQALRTRLLSWLRALPLVGVALALVVAFGLVSRWLGAREAWFRRGIRNPFLADLVRQLSATGLFVLGVLLALQLLEATALVGALLGAAGLLGVAVGFAFRDLAENYITSLLLSIRQPFAPNDHVVIDGEEGKVIRLTSRATILMTLDGNHLRLPNAKVFKASILNYTRNPLRRFAIGVGVGVGEDLVEAQRLGVRVLAATDGVLRDPEPWSEVAELGDSNVALRFYGWVDQREANFIRVRSSAVRRVKDALDEAEIDMPEPTYRVRVERASRRSATGDEPGHPPAQEAPAPVEQIEEADAVDRQIAAERARSPADDLLDRDAPKE
ncbi:MAG: mechanosensitive ion channel [Thermoanaerobaculia bacterium]